MLTIRDGKIILELTPIQCATIAKACQQASRQTDCDDLDSWRTMGALFQACAAAGYAHWHLSPFEADTWAEELVIAGLVGDEPA